MAPAENLTPRRTATPVGPAPQIQVNGADAVVYRTMTQKMSDPKFTGDPVEAGKQEVKQRLSSLMTFIKKYGDQVRSDKGEMHLVSVDVDGGTAEVLLSGACSACQVSDRTLRTNMVKALALVKKNSANGLDWLESVNGNVLEVTNRDELRHDFEIGTGGFVPKATLAIEFGPAR